MKCCVSIEARHTGQGWRRNTQKRRGGSSAKGGEAEIEPHNIRLVLLDRPHQPQRIAKTIKFPATFYRESIQFRLGRGILVPKNRQLDARNALQFTGYMEPVFVQRI